MNVLRKFVLLVLLLAAMRAGAQTQVVGLPAGRVDGDVEVSGKVAVGTTVLTDKQQKDIKCEGDITAAVSTAITSLMAADGGTIRLSSGSCYVTALDTLPNDGATKPTQKPLRITGQGPSMNGYWEALPVGGTMLDLRENDSVAKIDTRGAGVLEIDHLTLMDSQSDCATFIHTTNTALLLHDLAISGTAAGKAACNDAVILGGTTEATNGTAAAAFQGYGTDIYHVFFDKVRKAVYGRTWANAITVHHNTISKTSGSAEATAAITAATNASPTVLTSAHHGIGKGKTASMIMSGFTGSWAVLNGTKTVTGVTADTFSVAVDSSGFGAMSGTPVFQNGAAIVFDAVVENSYDVGNVIADNIFELGYYPYGIKFGLAVHNTVTGNGFYDPGAGVLAGIRQDVYNIASYNLLIDTFTDSTIPFVSSAGADPFNHSTIIGSGPLSGMNLENLTRLFILDGSPRASSELGVQCVAGSAQGTPITLYDSSGNPKLTVTCAGNGRFYGSMQVDGGANFGTWINFRNGGNYVGFSDDGVTEKWRITGATGVAKFGGYQSSDGTAGMTGSCASTTTLTVKNGLITACN